MTGGVARKEIGLENGFSGHPGKREVGNTSALYCNREKPAPTSGK
jgi:hypothetical protein